MQERTDERRRVTGPVMPKTLQRAAQHGIRHRLHVRALPARNRICRYHTVTKSFTAAKRPRAGTPSRETVRSVRRHTRPPCCKRGVSGDRTGAPKANLDSRSGTIVLDTTPGNGVFSEACGILYNGCSLFHGNRTAETGDATSHDTSHLLTGRSQVETKQSVHPSPPLAVMLHSLRLLSLSTH